MEIALGKEVRKARPAKGPGLGIAEDEAVFVPEEGAPQGLKIQHGPQDKEDEEDAGAGKGEIGRVARVRPPDRLCRPGTRILLGPWAP